MPVNHVFEDVMHTPPSVLLSLLLASTVPFFAGNLAIQASLGLRQPYGCSSQAAIAEWEASLRRSTVSLRAFRKALAEAGLVLGRTRVRGDKPRLGFI